MARKSCFDHSISVSIPDGRDRVCDSLQDGRDMIIPDLNSRSESHKEPMAWRSMPGPIMIIMT